MIMYQLQITIPLQVTTHRCFIVVTECSHQSLWSLAFWLPTPVMVTQATLLSAHYKSPFSFKIHFLNRNSYIAILDARI